MSRIPLDIALARCLEPARLCGLRLRHSSARIAGGARNRLPLDGRAAEDAEANNDPLVGSRTPNRACEPMTVVVAFVCGSIFTIAAFVAPTSYLFSRRRHRTFHGADGPFKNGAIGVRGDDRVRNRGHRDESDYGFSSPSVLCWSSCTRGAPHCGKTKRR